MHIYVYSHTVVVFMLVYMCCVCRAASPEPPLALWPPAPTLCSALSPSDRLVLCQERMFVFESCQDIKHGLSPTRGRINKLATSSKVRGNMTSQSASLIGSGLLCDKRKWMDPDSVVWIIFNPFASRRNHVSCLNSILHTVLVLICIK